MLLPAGAGLVTVVVVMGALSAAQLFFSDKLALSAMGAKEVSPQEAPGLHAMIEKLCIQADLPKPRIAVADTDVPNAFAVGRSQKTATVCATTGIMRTLSPSELEGVMAHELAHVKHRDVLIMTIASFFASLAAIILQFGFFFGGGGDDDNPSFIVVLLVSFVVYVVSFFLMMALSRYREFAADRGAAIVTGRPSALSSALVKISGAMQKVPTQRPARGRADERVLHRADERQGRDQDALLDAPADGEADRAPAAARVAAPGHAPPRPVGFLDALFGSKGKLKGAAPDRLFAMTTANVTMETGLGPEEPRLRRRRLPADRHRRLQGRSSTETEELLAGTAEETGTKVETHDDEFGYRWLILRDPDFDDLVVAMNTVSVQLQGAGYGDRLLAAVFAFEEEGQADLLHLQLQARRLLPLRAREGRAGARHRARAAHQVPARRASCHGKRTWPAGSRSGTSARPL